MHVPQYLRALNPEQQAAALATDGPVLVLAGAGSGKTRTLVYRISHLIRIGVSPRKILAVTFTNRAATEMRERVASVVGKDARGVTLSTFHSLGARILREYADRLGLPEKFSIYDSGDQASIIRRVVGEEVRVAATVGDDRYDLKRILFQISAWKNDLTSPADVRARLVGSAAANDRSDDYAVLAADVYPRYEEALRAAGACDFDDLLLLPVRLLREDADARESLWRRWQYLMIDEYQDTNAAQLEMARLLAGPRKNLCVVGDDDQSIYAWRGADSRNILDFERHYPGASVVVLEENYRSTQRILDAANAVILNNAARKPKQLRTANGPGPRLDLWEFTEAPGGSASAEEQEAEMVAREIGIRRYVEKLGWSDFAVLYRTNLQARPLEEALRAANVPYRVIGGTSYFERTEIANAIAYLSVVVNPRDEVALRRILNYPARGIGRTTQLKLLEDARRHGDSLWQALQRRDGSLGLTRPQAEAIQHFVELIEESREALTSLEGAISRGEAADRALEAWTAELLRRLRLEEAIRAEFGKGPEGGPKADRAVEMRIDNLRNFVASVGAFETRRWAERPLPDEEIDWSPPELSTFLERVSLSGEDDDRKEKEEDEPDRVTLLTLHSAKGLEFSHVFMVGLEEEILPHARSIQAVGEEGAGDPVAEERRLFYVGITRARHRLTLSGCATRRRSGESTARVPSRFLAEIPTELLERRSPSAESSLDEESRQEMKGNFFASMKQMLAE